MSLLSPEQILLQLANFAQARQRPFSILLVGGLALHFYGLEERATMDVDAEVKSGLEDLFHFLKKNNVPSDLSENFSGWSMVAMPPGYEQRAQVAVERPFLEVKILEPTDFIIAKLRRFTETDIQDALFVVKKNNISLSAIRQRAESAIQNSVKDTALFLFRNNVETFLKLINPG